MRVFQAHHLNRVSRVRFTPDARTLTVALRQFNALLHLNAVDGTEQRWRPERGAQPTDLAYSADGGFVGVATGWSVSTFRRTLLTTTIPGNAHQFELLSGFSADTSNLPRLFPVSVAFSPTSELRTARFGIASRELLLWNPHTLEYIVAPDEGDYRGVSFGPDGTTVASIEYHAHALCVWNVKPFRVLFRTDLKGIDAFDNGAVAMLPDGERVIVAAGNVLRCVPIRGGAGWDTTTKKPPLEIALHPSGRMLLVADGSKKVMTYDTSNGKAAAQFDWGVGKVGCVTYSPDGTLAAAGGEKGQVVVWDAE
jgi:WD40 repeat protein